MPPQDPRTAKASAVALRVRLAPQVRRTAPGPTGATVALTVRAAHPARHPRGGGRSFYAHESEMMPICKESDVLFH